MVDDIWSIEKRQLSSINSKLRKGELTRAQAEIEIKREGFIFGKLSDPSYDPDSYSDWTPLQAIAWIATRDIGRVRSVSSEARQHAVTWTESHIIRLLDKPSIDLLADIAPIAERARADLWTRLRAREIQASGINAPSAPRLKISSLEWVDLRLFGDETVFLGDRFLSSSHSYFKVRIDRGAIVAIWPGLKAGDDEGSTRAEVSPARNKRGRRPDYDWDMIKGRAFELMDEHGDFSADDEWNAQARLEEALKSFCSEKLDRAPADSSLRGKLPDWREEWLSRKLKT